MSCPGDELSKTILEELEQLEIIQKITKREDSSSVSPLNQEILSNDVVTRCIFAGDKDGKLYLICQRENGEATLKTISQELGLKSMRCCDQKQLMEILHVSPQQLSPLSLLNDKEGRVIAIIDDSLLDAAAIDLSIYGSKLKIRLGINEFDRLLRLYDRNVKFFSKDKKKMDKCNQRSQNSNEDECGNTDTKSITKGGKTTKRGEITQDMNEKGFKEGITVSKDTNFSAWYTQVIIRGELIEYYDISGCYILRPDPMHWWETCRRWFDNEIEKLGVENCYFPLLVSKGALEKEKDHLEGFSPEVAWITHSGDSQLNEPVAIRPTSETVMYPTFSKWIRSHRDLPLKINQWGNVVRWEFRQPTPFIRTREFLWQEGHTAHATEDEARIFARNIQNIYAILYEYLLAIPTIKGIKSDGEKFAGALETYTLEVCIRQTGRGIQAATSHLLGTNFAKMFDIQYEDKEGIRRYAHQTSWGITTRSLGIMIMTHGDDKGIIVPPRIAHIQIVIIPIVYKEQDKLLVGDYLDKIMSFLCKKFRVHIDDRETNTPGWKFNYWELRGVPVRMEIGLRDIASNAVSLVRRDTGIRKSVPANDESLVITIQNILDNIHDTLLVRAKESLRDSIKRCYTFDEAMDALNMRLLVLVPWCGEKDTEDEIKAKTAELSRQAEKETLSGSAKPLCIPFEAADLAENTMCFWKTNTVAKYWALFGRSY